MERIGIAFSRGLKPQEVVECVQLAEELGYESAWMAEGHGGDQFSILTGCALATKTILLGTCISSVFVRSAPTIAMATACVDQFSGGRFILGLGSSHKVQVDGEHGLVFSQPVQRLRECMDIVSMLLRDGTVSYKGNVFNIEHFDLGFEPVRKEVPIYLSAVFPKMLEICGEIAQGVILFLSTLDHSKNATEHVARGARRAGRNPEEVDISTMIPCVVSADKDAARDTVRPAIANVAGHFPRYRRLMGEAGFVEELDEVHQAWKEGDTERAMRLVPSGLIDRIALVGTADECREGLQNHRQAGIDLPIIYPSWLGKDVKRQAIDVIRACAPR